MLPHFGVGRVGDGVLPVEIAGTARSTNAMVSSHIRAGESPTKG